MVPGKEPSPFPQQGLPAFHRRAMSQGRAVGHDLPELIANSAVEWDAKLLPLARPFARPTRRALSGPHGRTAVALATPRTEVRVERDRRQRRHQHNDRALSVRARRRDCRAADADDAHKPEWRGTPPLAGEVVSIQGCERPSSRSESNAAVQRYPGALPFDRLARRIDFAELERRGVGIERNQRLPTVVRERVAVERQCHQMLSLICWRRRSSRSLGSSGPKPPVGSSPVGSYDAMTTPWLETK